MSDRGHSDLGDLRGNIDSTTEDQLPIGASLPLLRKR
jgi:hypothetical protein